MLAQCHRDTVTYLFYPCSGNRRWCAVTEATAERVFLTGYFLHSSSTSFVCFSRFPPRVPSSFLRWGHRRNSSLPAHAQNPDRPVEGPPPVPSLPTDERPSLWHMGCHLWARGPTCANVHAYVLHAEETLTCMYSLNNVHELYVPKPRFQLE